MYILEHRFKMRPIINVKISMATSIIQSRDTTLRKGPPIVTRGNTEIETWYRLEANPARRKAMVEVIGASCPSGQPRSITQTYNCIGMVFASRRVWIDSNYFYTILSDDGYRPLGGLDDVQVGDLIVYKNPNGEFTHVAIFIKKEPIIVGGNKTRVWVLGQFGFDGEWIHPHDEVPKYCGKPVEYWTERRDPV